MRLDPKNVRATETGQSAEPQYLSDIDAMHGIPLEPRSIPLTSEEWRKLDEIAKKCPVTSYRNGGENHAAWVLRVFMFLCEQDERYQYGVCPTPVQHEFEPPRIESVSTDPNAQE